MKKLLITTAAISLALFSTANAEEGVSDRIAKLEQEIELLKRQQEVKEEVEKSNSEKFAKVELGNKGLAVNSPDGKFQLKLRAYAQADNRTFIDNNNKDVNTSQFLIRSARPIIEGKFYDDFAGRIMLDFGNGQTRLLDAYADYKPDSAFNLRLGKFKAPIGLERWQSEQELLFAERGMATNLVSLRDIGVQAYGELIPQTLEYQIALTNGAADLVDGNSDLGNSKDVTARVFSYPFRNGDIVAVQGLGVGIAGSYGTRDGSSTVSELTSGYKTPGQASFFTYSSGSYGDGVAYRINPELYYSYGPLGILGDYVSETQHITKTGTTAKLTNTAATLVASYVLTGEDASFDGVKPAENFNPSSGAWGAFEVLGRYGYFHADSDTFPTFASASTSAQTAKEGTLGLNWYLNPNLKFNFDFSDTRFEGGAAAGADRPDEKVVISRAQFRF